MRPTQAKKYKSVLGNARTSRAADKKAERKSLDDAFNLVRMERGAWVEQFSLSG